MALGGGGVIFDDIRGKIELLDTGESFFTLFTQKIIFFTMQVIYFPQFRE